MANLKTWKVSLPEDSPVLQDLLEYGRDMGMQPAETTRVILSEWSRAMRGRNPFGTMMPQMVAQPAGTETSKPKEQQGNREQEKAKARGARFAKTFAPLDDD